MNTLVAGKIPKDFFKAYRSFGSNARLKSELGREKLCKYRYLWSGHALTAIHHGKRGKKDFGFRSLDDDRLWPNLKEVCAIRGDLF